MNENVKANLAKNIKKIRKQNRLSQEALSLELDFDGSYIGKIENRQMNVTIDRLIAIANFFKVDFKELFRN